MQEGIENGTRIKPLGSQRESQRCIRDYVRVRHWVGRHETDSRTHRGRDDYIDHSRLDSSACLLLLDETPRTSAWHSDKTTGSAEQG